ncbi:MAG: hypothetical protein JWN30_219, partial [Bacilli bacterium]|nr:hypothetical protein [Bacilli bacterium]
MTMFDYKPILRTNIFYKFLFSYILVILIPILGLGFLSYVLFSNSMQKEVQHNNALILSRMSDTLDQKLEDTKNMMYQSVLSLSGSETDYTKLQDAITLLSRIKNTDKFIDDVFVYYPKTGVIIRSDGLYQADFFFEHFYKYEGEGLTDWLNQFPRNDFSVIPTQNVKVRNNDSEKEITFLTSFPLFNQVLDGTLVVMVNSSTVQSIISNSLLATDGQSQIQIINKNLQLISPSNVALDKTIAGQLLHTDSNAS